MTNPVLEAKITDIHSWWEVPCIAHFCSLFRASFNLIDFDIEDLEEALLTDDASDSGSTLIQELIVRLLRGYYGNNSISTFNYQMFLRRLFRQKCREFNCDNPFDNDMDFQFLPMRTKVEILHMLCDFRLDADDVLDILKDLDSDSLRVHPLGYDANKSAYWYFYGTRLYREDYPKKKAEEVSKKKRKGKKNRNKEESDDEVELGSGIWQVVCFTESDWERLALNTEDATDKNEQTLHQIIEEDFLPEIPKLFQEKERLQRKRFLELHPRKSSRLENIKRKKEEENPDSDESKRAFNCDATESDDSQYNAEQAKNARYERWKNRNIQKEVVYDSDNFNSDSESFQESLQYFNQKSSIIVGRGRQTNNSLSSATGEILIDSADRSRSPEWFDPKLEDLHIGMYKVLNKLKDHEDSWPFLQPVNEDDAPNYYQVVKSPMSLQKMEEKLDGGRYKSLSEFKNDFHLILANCKQYNGSENEYTLMGENLEKVFNISVHRYIILSNSSEGDEGTEINDFHDLSGSLKKKKRRKFRRISSKSTVEADKENERKISSMDLVSTEAASHTVDVSMNLDSRILEHKPVKRGKGRPPKNASTFDAFDIVAEQTLRDINKLLDDTPKYSDFCSASNSPSLPSPPKIAETSLEEFPSDTVIEPSPPDISVPKTTSAVSVNPVRPYKHKDPNKKRSVKENHHKHLQIIKQSRRDPQRTIDRLQPGKSKGNLISTISKTQSSSRTTTSEELSASAKTKENVLAKTTTTSAENTQHRVKPMLSLGSVLSHDVINLDAKSKKHTFSDNDSAPSEEEDFFSDNDETSSALNKESNELQAENLALDKPCSESYSNSNDDRRSEDKPSTDVPSKSENSSETAKASSMSVEKSDKPKPNASAWFKAFGAPKIQSVVKRKNDGNVGGMYHEQPATPSPTSESKDEIQSRTSQMKSAAATNALSVDDDRYDLNELPPPTPGRFFTYDEESHSRPIPSLPSPDMKPLKRQRKLSTGSSVSERSSFSQDPNDPLNSPHPSIDESVYQSPQPYHQSPSHGISGALKVGFYQDTFPKGSSDKSNSCSPREPVNGCSPQHPMFSPRNTIASPRGRRDIVSSPHGSDSISSPRDQGYGLQIASPMNAVTSPRYASGSPRESYAESSPISTTATCTKSPPVYSPSPAADQEAQLPPRMPTHNEIDQPESSFRAYTAATPTPIPVEKSPFSIYPVKKRISAELEHTSRLQEDAPVTSNVAEKQVYGDYPPPLSQHLLPPNPYSSAESGSKVASSSVPISLAHHPAHSHHPHFMNSYSDNLLLSANPYFCKDMYVPSQAVGAPPPASIGQPAPRISPLFMQQADTSAGIYSASSDRNQSHYSSSRQTPLMGARSYDRNSGASGGTPLDFTTVPTSSASPSPLSLTSKAASDAYNAQFHHPRFHSAPHSDGNVLNFSNKNLTQSSSIYANQNVATEAANRTAQSPLMHYHQPPSISASPNPNNGNGMHLSAENMYRGGAPTLENKHAPTIGNYRGPPYHNVPNAEYFNDPKMSASYRSPDLRYPNYPLTNGEKQYYPVAQPKNGAIDGSTEVANYNNHRLATNCAPPASSNTRYDISSYHGHRGGGILPPASTVATDPSVMNATSATTSKSGRKSKKKKAAAAVPANSIELAAEQSAMATASMYSHFLGGNQPSSVAAAAAAAAAASQDFQPGLIPSGFNFGASPSVVQKEYHQYFDNFRNQRYFAGSAGGEMPSNSAVAETKTASPVANHPSSSTSSPSFQFLTQRGSPSFSLAAQAFINANATPPPCGPPPPSIYSSPYLQRAPEDLLRPMILPQGLMSAHTGAYPPPHPPPHGYINTHDPISRSPWL